MSIVAKIFRNHMIFVIVLGLLFPDIAYANGLPNFAVQHNPNGTISPLNKVPVVIDKEVLTIVLSGQNPALIKAKYTLKSLSDKKISTTVIFPVADNQKASVIYNGYALNLLELNQVDSKEV